MNVYQLIEEFAILPKSFQQILNHVQKETGLSVEESRTRVEKAISSLIESGKISIIRDDFGVCYGKK